MSIYDQANALGRCDGTYSLRLDLLDIDSVLAVLRIRHPEELAVHLLSDTD